MNGSGDTRCELVARIQRPGAARRADGQAHLVACRRPGGLVLHAARCRSIWPPSCASCRRMCRCCGSGSAAICWCATAACAAPSMATHGALGALERISATRDPRRGRRAVRAHRAAMREMGSGAGGVLCRHSRHAGRRARDECGRLGRRDLAACGRGGGARSPRHAPHAHARPITRSAIARCSGPADEWFVGARLEFERKPGVNTDARSASCSSGAARRSRSASGAADRCSRIRRAITRRG